MSYLCRTFLKDCGNIFLNYEDTVSAILKQQYYLLVSPSENDDFFQISVCGSL